MRIAAHLLVPIACLALASIAFLQGCGGSERGEAFQTVSQVLDLANEAVKAACADPRPEVVERCTVARDLLNASKAAADALKDVDGGV